MSSRVYNWLQLTLSPSTHAQDGSGARPSTAISGRDRKLVLGCALLAAAVMSAFNPVWAGTTVADSGPVRRTESGAVSGQDGEVLSFKGVPYAAAPVGDLRWRPPQSPPRWRGVRSSIQFGSDCFGDARLRQASLAPAMGEDCLYLNVWTPRQTVKPRAVMVWVYGGSFTGGTSAIPLYDGAALARDGVVVVTFNYRANIFGFFAHPELTAESPDGASGNYGLLDILAALQWVQRNISAFGGDPHKVTVFGESAGASALGLLLTSPKIDGLVQQAILESPGLTRPLASLAESSALGSKLGDIKTLRAMDGAALLSLAQSGLPVVRSLQKPRAIGPIVDGRVLVRGDGEAIAQGRFLHVPMIIGSNADEGRLFTRAIPLATLAEYHAFLAAQFGVEAAAMARCYPASADKDVPQALSRLFGNEQFIRGIDAFSASWARWKVPVWRYRFDGPGDPNTPPPTHAAELPFVFSALALNAPAADAPLSNRMRAAWTTFAKSGDPTIASVPRWPRYSSGELLVFGPSVTVRPAMPLPGLAECGLQVARP